MSDLAAVSQFTLLASTKKGNKPDFHGALGGDEAKRLYQYFYQKVEEGYAADRVKDGVFQAMMEVALVNDGPVRLFQTAWHLSLSLTLVQVTIEVVTGSKQPADKAE